MGNIEITEKGPLRVTLKAIHQLSSTSSLTQIISISAASKIIEFNNDLDWNENRKILKVNFPLNVNCDFATFETQFGVLQRPTHRNSSWDLAKFEVCAHKFVDLSEYGYGVALLNDCKYGFAVCENVISMSIVRSPKAPDDLCDIGKHTFRYALYPHKGTFPESDVVQVGYEFNVPIVPLSCVPSITESMFRVDQPNVVIDTIKPAEDDEKDIVLRLFETHGGRGRVTIKSCYTIKKAMISNVLEEEKGDIKLMKPNEFQLDYTPFKILTVRLLMHRES